MNDQYNGTGNYKKVKKALSFLIDDFGFSINNEKEYLHEHECGESLFKVISYDNSQIDIEFAICLDSTMIHFDIRKIINGLPANYYDEVYCISKEELFQLTHDSRMDDYQLKYHEKLDLLTELLKKSIALLSNGHWLPPGLIAQKVENLTKMSMIKYYTDRLLPMMEKHNFKKTPLNLPSYIGAYKNKNVLDFSNNEKKISIVYDFDYREQYSAIYVYVNGDYFKGLSKGDFHQFLRITLQEAIEL